MRKALTWLAGLAGIAALLRRRSRQQTATLHTASVTTPDPVVELRQKLQETRTDEPQTPSEVEAPSSLGERRARVHERAQDAINLMRTSDEPPEPEEESTT